jgi:AcrR family transcriptional regulator
MTDRIQAATTPAGEGIRERKKRLTRELISNTATRMFMDRGFDEVKVTDIARECDVSEKTVYNYFPTKESLLLDREDAMAESVTRAFGPVASLPPVEAALGLLATQLAGILGALPSGEPGVTALRRFTELLDSTSSLRAAQRDLDIRLVDAAARAMAARAGVSPDEPEPQIAAQAIIGLWRIQFGALRRYTALNIGVADGLRGKVTADVRRAAQLLDSGLWSFGVMVSAPDDHDQLQAAAAAAQSSSHQVTTALRRARSAWLPVPPADDAQDPALVQQ